MWVLHQRHDYQNNGIALENPSPKRCANPRGSGWQFVSLRLTSTHPACCAQSRDVVIPSGGLMANRKQKSDSGKSKQAGRPGSGRREANWGEVSNWLDDWLAIKADGTINAFSGKVELGTGVRTALTQIVAEELDVPLERVHMIMGDTARTPDEGYTAGSMTISGSGTALRRAAAEARHTMLEMAAER